MSNYETFFINILKKMLFTNLYAKDFINLLYKIFI